MVGINRVWDFQDFEPRVGQHDVSGWVRRCVPGYHQVAGGVGVIGIEKSIRGKVGMESDTQQTALSRLRNDRPAAIHIEVLNRGCQRTGVIHRDNTGAFRNKNPVRIVACMDKLHGGGQPADNGCWVDAHIGNLRTNLQGGKSEAKYQDMPPQQFIVVDMFHI
ncbi:hypothetical protein D3C86_1725360 [compost metagenome]